MSTELDPEALADLRKRESLARQRGDGDPTTSYERPVDVTSWPCRICGAPVGVTRDVVDGWASLNRILARRREPPIPSSDVVCCAPCRPRLVAELDARERRKRAEIDQAIRELRTLSAAPLFEQRAQVLVKRLETLGYGSTNQLLQQIRDERAGSATTNTKRRNTL